MNIPFTQTKEYLKWHQEIGTKTFYKEFFGTENFDVAEERLSQIDDEKEFVTEKKVYAICASLIINLRIGKVLYVPYGPALSPLLLKEEPGVVKKVVEDVKVYLFDLAKKENCIFVRMEENVMGESVQKNSDDHKLFSEGRKKSFRNFRHTIGLHNLFVLPFFSTLFFPPKKTFAKEGIFQPRVEWWLDLQNPPNPPLQGGATSADVLETLYNSFHKDHKYSIRRAQKENVEVEIINLGNDLDQNFKEKYFAEFWKLLKETGERDGFGLYEENYYKQIFESQNPPSQGYGEIRKFLVFTKTPPSLPEVRGGIEVKYMSVALVVISDKIANLVFAGSVSEKRELGFNHLMQWEAIKESKRLGCEIYNFGGIYENGYGKEGLRGVTNFKKRFGGYVKQHVDFVDIPVQKIKYFLYILKKYF